MGQSDELPAARQIPGECLNQRYTPQCPSTVLQGRDDLKSLENVSGKYVYINMNKGQLLESWLEGLALQLEGSCPPHGMIARLTFGVQIKGYNRLVT